MQEIYEGKAKILVETKKVVDKKMPVFYNPLMKTNRDLTIFVLKKYSKDNWKIGLPLAGSGIRAIRILKEVNQNLNVYVNDLKRDFLYTMADNAKINEINSEKLHIHNEDANIFLNKHHFDYIDIDPFGTPNPFLDSATRSIKNGGILAVTATDTGALSGTYVDACKRKYFATPKRDERMHETGIRILIRKVQMIGAQHDVALTPVYSISQLHYMKVFFLAEKQKKKVDEILKKHEFLEEKYGPIWTGNLWDLDLAIKIGQESEEKILKTIASEAQIKGQIYDIHKIAKRNKMSQIPKFEKILEKTKGSKTHFSDTCIKTELNEKEIIKIIQQLF